MRTGANRIRIAQIAAIASVFAALIFLAPDAHAVSACAIAKSDAYSASREAQGLDGVVSMDQLKEFEQQCAAEARTKRPQPRQVQRNGSANSANADIHAAAARGANLFLQPRVRQMYLALMPRGSSGAAWPIPQGPFSSSSNGEFALTRVCDSPPADPMCRNHTAILIDLRSGEAAVCQRVLAAGPPIVAWQFKDQESVLDTDGKWCPFKAADIPPDLAASWRTAQAQRRPTVRTASPSPAASSLPVPSPAAQQCILGKMTAYVRDRELRGLDSSIPAATSVQFREQCGAPGVAAVAAAPTSPAPAGGNNANRFDGHCNGMQVAGRDWHEPGRCPGGVELALGALRGNRPSPSLLTLRVPAPNSPVVVLQLEEAKQGYVNNDIITFTASPISGLPFTWTRQDRLECDFVKNPADGMAAALRRIQPNATLMCTFNGGVPRDFGKFHFGFFADTADIGRFRAAFVAAFDRLNPGRPFVSPTPDMQEAKQPF